MPLVTAIIRTKTRSRSRSLKICWSVKRDVLFLAYLINLISNRRQVFFSRPFFSSMYKAYEEHNKTTMAAEASTIKTILFLGSVREGRFGLRVAKFVKQQLENAKHHVEIFDPMEMQFPICAKPLHHYQDRSKAPAWLVEADKKLQEADAIVVVSAEYNHTMPPALTNMMDHFPCSSFAYKPSGIVCYSLGPYGGMRAAMHLRSFLGELGCISVSNIFGIPSVNGALDENGLPQNDHMIPGAGKLIAQLDWHARAMKGYKATHGTPK